MLLDPTLLSETVPLPATLNAITELFFLFGRHSGGNVLQDMGPNSLDQNSAQSRPEGRPLGNKVAASADPHEENDYGGYLKPIHTLGWLGTM